MVRARSRRVLAGLAVTVALIGTGVPATAQAAADEMLGVFLPDVTVAAGTAGKEISPILFVEGEQTLNDLTMSLDYSAIAGTVTVSESGSIFFDCTTAAAVITCASRFPVSIRESLAGLVRFIVAPTGAGAVGDTGSVTTTATATGFTPATDTSRITIGEGVDLAAPELQAVDATPGSTVGISLSVRNAGGIQVDGAVLLIFQDFALGSPVKYSNCLYVGDDPLSCEFDTTLAPGASYTLSSPYQVKLRSDIQAPSAWGFETSWLTQADWADFRSLLTRLGVPTGTPGTGPTLELVEAADALAPPQTDTEPLNNFTFTTVNVEGDQQSDLAAIGDTATGAVGAEVEVEVGANNLGPVILSTARAGEPITSVLVSIPGGVSAVGVPDECFPMGGGGEAGEPGHRDYSCSADVTLFQGESSLFPFTLRIDQAVSNATGPVRLNDDPQTGPAYPEDINTANNTANIVINPTPGSGGSLPITGARTGLFAGVGAALLLLGAAGHLLARRRRVRFVTTD